MKPAAGGSLVRALACTCIALCGGVRQGHAHDSLKRDHRRTIVDLVAKKIIHNNAGGDLEENREESPGAFLPLNNDDDDYDASNMADAYQAGAVPGETDLLPILLRAVEPIENGGTYSLTIPGHVNIWSNDNRSGEVSAFTIFDASVDTTLFVEGISEGRGSLQLNWSSANGRACASDRVNVSVFRWQGPLNVPGFAVYRYSAAGALDSSRWITPGGGAIHVGEGSSEVDVLWGEGPTVGRAVYEVNSDYVWDLEVNVVQMKFQSRGNRATYNSNPSQPSGPGSGLIDANAVGNAMASTITIAKVEGPLVGSGRRGVKFMEVGHVHQAQFIKKHGLYNDTTPRKLRRSNLEDGMLHWDSFEQGSIPWTFSNSAHYLAPDNDTTVSNFILSTIDTPVLLGKDISSCNGDQVDVMNIVMAHRTYIAVRSRTADVDGSSAVLTQRAKLDWTFDGSGTINASGVWTLTGGGSTGDAAFKEIQTGQRVPAAAANINESFASESWTTEDQEGEGVICLRL